MFGNFANGTQDIVYIGNNYSNKNGYDQSNPSLYVDPNWRLYNDTQFVSPFKNSYSPDLNSEQILSIPLNL